VICSAQPRNVALDYTRRAMQSEGRAPLARNLYTRESGARIIIIDQQRQSTASRNLFPGGGQQRRQPSPVPCTLACTCSFKRSLRWKCPRVSLVLLHRVPESDDRFGGDYTCPG
jgi:hypothetical protein